jgi:hypothetical protein
MKASKDKLWKMELFSSEKGETGHTKEKRNLEERQHHYSSGRHLKYRVDRQVLAFLIASIEMCKGL